MFCLNIYCSYGTIYKVTADMFEISQLSATTVSLPWIHDKDFLTHSHVHDLLLVVTHIGM